MQDSEAPAFTGLFPDIEFLPAVSGPYEEGVVIPSVHFAETEVVQLNDFRLPNTVNVIAEFQVFPDNWKAKTKESDITITSVTFLKVCTTL